MILNLKIYNFNFNKQNQQKQLMKKLNTQNKFEKRNQINLQENFKMNIEIKP